MFTFFLGGGGNPVINLTISADTTTYDIFTAAGSPTYPVDVILTINSAVVVGSTSTSGWALDTGTGWHSLSTISIINNGYIYGKGGVGGAGGSIGPLSTQCYGGSAGSAGGPALKLQHNVTITNGSGYIFGGGGGGGGGAAASESPGASWSHDGGGGGGGGRTYGTTSGGAGGAASGGTFNTNGTAGNTGTSSGGASGGPGGDGDAYGGTGGDWGAAGGAGNVGSCDGGGTCCSAFSGGAAGKAIDLNGKTITWVSGNDSTHVKGAVS